MHGLRDSFTRTFYKKLELILLNTDRFKRVGNLKWAREEGFQVGNVISGLETWKLDLANCFRNAVAEALTATIDKYVDHNGTNKAIIENHAHFIVTTLIPDLIKGLNPQAPLPLLKNRLREQIKSLSEEDRSLADNPYLIWGTLAAVSSIATISFALALEI